MTEDEAKQKRCCVAGCGSPVPIANVVRYYCAASECMGWRWTKIPPPEDVAGPEGYCGRAGDKHV